MKKRSQASLIALCGLLAALAVAIMIISEIVPAATYSCPVIAMILMVPVLCEFGPKWALTWYASVCVLSFILTFANPEASLLFVFLGYYPILRKYLNRINLLPIRLAIKLLLFNIAVAAVYYIFFFVFQLPDLVRQAQESGKLLIWGGIALANICFFLTDSILGKFEIYYAVKLRKKLHF